MFKSDRVVIRLVFVAVVAVVVVVIVVVYYSMFLVGLPFDSRHFFQVLSSSGEDRA